MACEKKMQVYTSPPPLVGKTTVCYNHNDYSQPLHSVNIKISHIIVKYWVLIKFEKVDNLSVFQTS